MHKHTHKHSSRLRPTQHGGNPQSVSASVGEAEGWDQLLLFVCVSWPLTTNLSVSLHLASELREHCLGLYKVALGR